MEMKIKKVSNGWVVQVDRDDEDFDISVIQNTEDEVLTFNELLIHIENELGPPTSRHSEKRTKILSLPGDKFLGELSKETKDQLIYLRDFCNIFLEDKNE